MNRIALVMVGACAMSASSACSFQPNRQQPGGTGGNGGTFVPGTGGMAVVDDAAVFRPDAAIEYIIAPDADPEAGPSTDANCGNMPFSVVIPPPSLLIVLDRSQSMTEDAAGNRGGPVAMQKWGLMTAAINQAVMDTQATINWGLMFFGSDSACGAETTATVPPALNNAAAIRAAITRAQPQSYTPTTKGELAAGTYLSTLTDMSRKFILLATDGQPTCGPPNFNSTSDADDPGAIAAVDTVAKMGFPTYVIGIATTSSATANDTLNKMADMGTQPRPAPADPRYYPVATTAELVSALNAIQTIVMGMCTYPLGTPGPNADPKVVTVTVDGVSSTKDAPDGWVYDPGMTSITFQGTTCANLLAGTAKNVQVLYGCKTIVE